MCILKRSARKYTSGRLFLSFQDPLVNLRWCWIFLLNTCLERLILSCSRLFKRHYHYLSLRPIKKATSSNVVLFLRLFFAKYRIRILVLQGLIDKCLIIAAQPLTVGAVLLLSRKYFIQQMKILKCILLFSFGRKYIAISVWFYYPWFYCNDMFCMYVHVSSLSLFRM